MSHHHPPHSPTSAARILTAFLLNLFFSVFELIGGIFTGSVAILSDALHDLGDAAGIGCICTQRPRAVAPVRTAPYPGFPTDAQAILMAAMLRSRGATVFEENIFTNRYRHVDELVRMGADIRVFDRTAVVTGTPVLHGTAVCSTDLRGGAALCVAGLSAEGETVVSGIEHIERGYADIAADLRCLGAQIVKT